jgi:hypothetical protein
VNARIRFDFDDKLIAGAHPSREDFDIGDLHSEGRLNMGTSVLSKTNHAPLSDIARHRFSLAPILAPIYATSFEPIVCP